MERSATIHGLAASTNQTQCLFATSLSPSSHHRSFYVPAMRGSRRPSVWWLVDGDTLQHLNLPAGGHRLAAPVSQVKPCAWIRRLQYTVVETCRAKSNPASDIRAVPRIWWLSQRPILRPGSVRSTAFHDNVYGYNSLTPSASFFHGTSSSCIGSKNSLRNKQTKPSA